MSGMAWILFPWQMCDVLLSSDAYVYTFFIDHTPELRRTGIPFICFGVLFFAICFWKEEWTVADKNRGVPPVA